MEEFNFQPIEVALKCGISIATIYNCLNGKRPRAKTAERIEAGTNRKVTIKELRGQDESE